MPRLCDVLAMWQISAASQGSSGAATLAGGEKKVFLGGGEIRGGGGGGEMCRDVFHLRVIGKINALRQSLHL